MASVVILLQTILNKTAMNTLNCNTLTDFLSVKAHSEWRVVNDNVMGGQSKGGFSIEDSFLIFSGDINTSGGGFSSIRMTLDNNALIDYKGVQVRLKTKDVNRVYRIIMEDKNLRSVTYRSPIELTSTENWQIVFIAFEDFKPSRRGQPLRAPIFEKSSPESIGFMLNDTFDGSFRLDIDYIKLCK